MHVRSALLQLAVAARRAHPVATITRLENPPQQKLAVATFLGPAAPLRTPANPLALRFPSGRSARAARAHTSSSR